MAPQPDNDNTPKAPDKNDKTKGDKHGNSDANKEKNKDFKTLNNLNDCELKDLLDEAITYKNPKDREGKSTLFKELLSQAEESERNARAASAGGSEQVRYCNTSAKRSKHRRKPNSISENVMHGGSLDNLAKEDLFEVVHHLSKPKRTVSARQREGGSLPSNVNAGSLSSYDPHFLEEALQKRTVRGGGSPEPMEVDMETANLLEHDSVAENYEKGASAEGRDNTNHQSAPKFTTKASLQVNVDDALHFKDLDHVEKKHDLEQISAKVLQTKYSVFIQDYNPINEASKKVDENGNALNQNNVSKAKKKKVQAEKNVMSSYSAEKLVGHRGDIINDVDKLVEFIGDGPQGGSQNKSNSHRQKQIHKNASEVSSKGGKKQKGAQSSKNKENSVKNDLKKSNSLEEISTTKLDGFKFDEDNNEQKSEQRKEEPDKTAVKAKTETTEKVKTFEVVTTEPKTDVLVLERPKERKTENVEVIIESSSDFHVVRKKKKTKKGVISLSGSRQKPSNAVATGSNLSKLNGTTSERRASSPVPRRKSVCSVPQSEKSNDSSDVDSVHSLPAGGSSQQHHRRAASKETPISYADIARNADKKQPEAQQKKQFSDAKVGNDSMSDHGSPNAAEAEPASPMVVMANAQTQTTPPKEQPPDVHNIKSFPAISKAAATTCSYSPVTLNKVDKSMNTSSPPKGQMRLQQQSNTEKPRYFQCNNVNKNNAKPQTAVASSQTNSTTVPETQPQQKQRDIKTDLSIIQANEIETVQMNNQMMPRMEIPDVQTIEKLNYMSQPGAHMPLHLQRHVVPPQHLHMAPPPQRPINQPPPHIPIMMPPPEMYPHHAPQAYQPPVMTHHHHHHHHHPTHHPLAYPAQAYEGAAVTYVDHAFLAQPPPPSGVIVVNHHIAPPPPPIVDNRQEVVNIPREKANKWAEGAEAAKAKPRQKRFDKSQNAGNVDRRKDSCGSRPSPSLTTPPILPNQTVTNAGRGPVQRRARGAEPTTIQANCDNEVNANDIGGASSGEEDRPPVVILSGAEAVKDVPGIEFGFAVNPDLVNPDVTTPHAIINACEFFDRFFRPPTNANADAYNHDKVVNYIGSAWEDLLNSGKAEYYSSSATN